MNWRNARRFSIWIACLSLACLGTTQAIVFAQEAAPIRFEQKVKIPMRDQIQLTADIYKPSAEGRFPTILVRTPYGRPGEKWDEGRRYAEAGYVCVVQDCRGRGDSQGEWEPFLNEPQDGVDTQAWIIQQTWSDGQVGTAGGSYVGWTQWASAPGAGSHLKAMVPIVPFANTYQDIAYPGGAMQMTLLFGWGAAVGGIPVPGDQLTSSMSKLPLSEWDNQFSKQVAYLDQWAEHRLYDDYWRQRGIDHRYADVKVPVLNIGGWYDIFSKPTIEQVDRVRAESHDRLARRNQFVIMGPWAHGPGVRKVGELDFGDAAELKLGQIQLNWFDYWMKQKQTGVEDWPAYKIFVMGENVWRDEHEWPLARTQFSPLYLSSKGHAANRSGDGQLVCEKPVTQPTDVFTYDPANPVPTAGGNNLVGLPIGPFDQSAVEDRSDVLVYSTDVLTEPMEVTGPIRVMLYASSTAPDTDFTAKLVDVHPDGKAYNLCDGILRGRYRQSLDHPQLMVPGEIYAFDIDLWVTSNVFLPGHRVRLEISSSNFPRFDRNLNTGQSSADSTEMKKATQTIYHDADHPSHVLLPIIPRGDHSKHAK